MFSPNIVKGVWGERCGCAKDWAEAQAPIMRCAVVHALGLTKRTPKAKCEIIANLKSFLMKLIFAGM